jgi:hypothetical protein
MKNLTVFSRSQYHRGSLELTRPVVAVTVLMLWTLSASAQTSYTWDGSVDTDFATADNWIPSGVPGSGDNITIVSTSNDPVLDGNRTVNDLTMTSGILKLGGYDLTADGTVSLNGGEIQNGRFLKSAGALTFSGTTMDCVVDIDAQISGIYNTIFKKKTTLSIAKTAIVYTGGNKFLDTTIIS